MPAHARRERKSRGRATEQHGDSPSRLPHPPVSSKPEYLDSVASLETSLHGGRKNRRQGLHLRIFQEPVRFCPRIPL